MNSALKVMAAIMMILVFAVSCKKSDVPNYGGNNNGENDSVVDPDENLNGHEYVDLGLPSGTLWATCNVGSDTPEGYGDYFARGEADPKGFYSWKNYKYGRFYQNRYEMNKYCTDSVFGLNGFVDSLTLLEPDDDLASTIWGTAWRTPTIEQWEEMFQNTTSVWTTLNGVNGWHFTASNGNSLFLPAAGYYWDEELNAADLGVYWSVTLNVEYPYRAWSFHFNSFQCHLCGSSDRNRGQTVRAVCSKK